MRVWLDKFNLKCEKVVKKRRILDLLFSVFIVCGLFLITYLKLPFTFETNDDWFMQDILSGATTGVPNAHAIFLNYGIGVLLATCYKINAIIPWYGIYLTGIWLICNCMIFHQITKRISFFSGKILLVTSYLFFYYYFEIPQIVTMQHMSTAGIAFGTAIFLFLITKEEDCYGVKQYILKYGIIWILVFICFSTRQEAFLLLIPAAGIAFLYKWLNNKKKTKEYIVFAGMIVTGIVVLSLIQKIGYGSPEWKEYTTFNQARSEMFDYYGIPDYDENKDLYQELSISKEVYQGMSEGYLLLFFDEISASDMKLLADRAKEIYKEQNTVSDRFQKSMENYIEFIGRKLENQRMFLLELLYFLVFLFVIWKKRWKTFFSLVVMLFVFRGCWIYLFFIQRPLERATFPLYFAEIIILLGVSFRDTIWDMKHKLIGNFMLIVLIPLIILIQLYSVTLHSYYDLRTITAASRSHYANLTVLDRYCLSNQDKIYFIDTKSITYFSEDVFDTTKPEKQNYIVVGGWLANSPLIKDKLISYEIFDSKKALIESENVSFIFNIHKEVTQDYLWNYLNSKYKYKVKNKEILKTSENVEFEIYQLESVETN